MKTAALLILLLVQSKCEEVPIPQGAGTPIEQLGSQVVVEGRYRDTTAWQQKNLQTDYEGQIEERTLEPRIITERVTAPPRVLTERFNTKPKYITERVEAPIKQRIITQPTLLNLKVKAEPRFVQGQAKTVNSKPVYLPAKVEREVINKPVNIPGSTITNNTYVQPVSKTIREDIQIQSAPEIRRELEPIKRQPVYQTVEETKKIKVPSNYVYRQNIVQPVYQRENVNLNIEQGPVRKIVKKPVTLPADVEQKTVAKQVTIPGSTQYYQKTYYPQVTNQQVNLRVQRTKPVYREAPAQQLQPIIRRSAARVNHEVLHQVPDFQNVPVKVPTIHRVPEYKDVPVKFKMPKLEDNIVMNVRDIDYDVEDLLALQGVEGYETKEEREKKKRRKQKKEQQDSNDYMYYHGGNYKAHMGRQGHGYHKHYSPDISNLF